MTTRVLDPIQLFLVPHETSDTLSFDFESIEGTKRKNSVYNTVNIKTLGTDLFSDFDTSETDGEICKFFLKGNCTKGSNCPYKHSKADKAVVCKHWLRGLCKKADACEFLHEYDLQKMPECYFYSKFGECSNPECLYLHINPEEKMIDCPWYDRGFCKHGPKCRHRHIRTMACLNYLKGYCPKGAQCQFGHPKYELPDEDELLMDTGSTSSYTKARGITMGVIGNPSHKGSNYVIQDTANMKQSMNDGQRPLEEVTCYKCGQQGHYANKCTVNKQPFPGQEDQFANSPWSNNLAKY